MSDAGVRAEVRSPGGETAVPLTWDGTKYAASFRPLDLAPNLGGTIRGGEWQIEAVADYYGSKPAAITKITVLHRLYLPLVLRNR